MPAGCVFKFGEFPTTALAPFVQVYVKAGVPLILTLVIDPVGGAGEQLLGEILGVLTICGMAKTVIFETDEFVHPVTAVPVTVYEVESVGDTTMFGPLALVLHVYVFPPPAVKVALLLEHRVDELTEIEGKAFTLTCDIAIFVHEFAAVPITV